MYERNGRKCTYFNQKWNAWQHNGWHTHTHTQIQWSHFIAWAICKSRMISHIYILNWITDSISFTAYIDAKHHVRLMMQINLFYAHSTSSCIKKITKLRGKTFVFIVFFKYASNASKISSLAWHMYATHLPFMGSCRCIFNAIFANARNLLLSLFCWRWWCCYVAGGCAVHLFAHEFHDGRAICLSVFWTVFAISFSFCWSVVVFFRCSRCNSSFSSS